MLWRETGHTRKHRPALKRLHQRETICGTLLAQEDLEKNIRIDKQPRFADRGFAIVYGDDMRMGRWISLQSNYNSSF